MVSAWWIDGLAATISPSSFVTQNSTPAYSADVCSELPYSYAQYSLLGRTAASIRLNTFLMPSLHATRREATQVLLQARCRLWTSTCFKLTASPVGSKLLGKLMDGKWIECCSIFGRACLPPPRQYFKGKLPARYLTHLKMHSQHSSVVISRIRYNSMHMKLLVLTLVLVLVLVLV